MSERDSTRVAANQALQCSNPSCGTEISVALEYCPLCGSLQKGMVLSQRFRIETVLGHGGMGAVYRATDLALERTVALKVFAPAAGPGRETPEALGARFSREARLAAQLDHPQIVPVLHFDMDGSRAYLVMPLFTGGTLADALGHQQPIAPTIVLDWLRQIAAALDYAHLRTPPIIHRDVKPSNLLFHADGRLCLADFGIARVGGEASPETAPLTRPGVVLGSAAYMAPEQINGHAVPASDQYSMGVILYEALTGRRPFEAGDPRALMLRHLSTTPPPPSQVVGGLSPEVDAAVLRALAKDPADRFPTLGALAEAFGAHAAPGPHASFPPSADPRGELPTQPVTKLHLRPGQASHLARGPGGAPAWSPPQQPQRQPSRWRLSISVGVAVLLVGIILLLGWNPRGETANQSGGSSPVPTQVSTPGTNPYAQTLQTAESHPPLFQDTLQSNNQHWELAHGAHFEEDGLHLPSNAGEGGLARKSENASAQQNHLTLPSSCAIEVDVAVTDPGMAYGFGLLSSDHSGYLLTFTAGGDYAVSLVAPEHPDTPQQLISGTKAGLALLPGQTAHLAVLIQGNQWAFFLQRQFITSIHFSSTSFPGAHLLSLLNLSGQDQPGGESLLNPSRQDLPAGEVLFEHLRLYLV